jgi:hypothetical protein
MKFMFLIILWVNISDFAIGQDYYPYYQLINQAELANIDKNYQKSDSLFVQAFKMVNRPFMADYYSATKNAILLKNYDKAFEYLNNAIDKGLTLQQLKNEPNFKILFKDKRFELLKKNYPKKRTMYLSKLNISLRDEVREMVRKDQKARAFLHSGNKMVKTDRQRFEQLKAIIKQYGWPGYSLIGEDGMAKKFGGKYYINYDIEYLLRHFNEKEIDYLLPYLKEAIQKGEIYPHDVAGAIDYNGIKTQHYGTSKAKLKKIKRFYLPKEAQSNKMYLFDDSGNPKYLILPAIESIEIVNQNRLELGLEPIQDYFKKIGVYLKQ